MTRYLTVAETAKLLRAALKKKFPGQKFNVRKTSYGDSIDVEYSGDLSETDVERVARKYEGARFDSMTDSKIHVEHWLSPDGTVTLATREPMYGLPRINTPNPGGAELVSFGADYIFVKKIRVPPTTTKSSKKTTVSSKAPSRRAPIDINLLPRATKPSPRVEPTASTTRIQSSPDIADMFEEMGAEWARRSGKRIFMLDISSVKETSTIPAKDVNTAIKSWYKGYDLVKK